MTQQMRPDGKASDKTERLKCLLIDAADALGNVNGYPGLGATAKHLITSINVGARTNIRDILRKGIGFTGILRDRSGRNREDS